MKVRLLLARKSLFRWQTDLALRLRRAGHAVQCRFEAEGECVLPRAAGLLIELETLIHGLHGHRPSASWSPQKDPVPDDAFEGDPDLILDLRGGETESAGTGSSPVLAPAYDGSRCARAAVEALLDQRAPVLSVLQGDAVVLDGLPAIERPDILTLGLDQVFARVSDLLLRAVAEVASGRPPARRLDALAAPSADQAISSATRFAAAMLGQKAGRRLRRLLGERPRWHVGWRRLGAARPVLDSLTWPAGAYSWLRDDGARFFADPFPIEHEGGVVVFCEEFPFRTQRGVISAFSIAEDGSVSTPKIVLERPYHLSYPFVFRHGGAIWMIPETSDNSTIELYRADPFPERWTLERVLVSNVAASDATLVQHGGLFWLFATATEPGGSSWDALHLFHAADLFGEWRPHPLNPVLVDASAARPAGAMRGGASLLRPAQDCRVRYGAGLTIAAIQRLDTEAFEQRVLARLPPAPGWASLGTHTLNAAGGIETMDSFGPHAPAEG